MSGKREHEESDTEDGWIGPLPTEAAPQKKQRGYNEDNFYNSHLNKYNEK